MQGFLLAVVEETENFTSFRNKDIDKFVRDHDDNCIDKVDMLKENMNK